MGKEADWLREERRNVLGHWTAFCLDCGAARRWFADFEDEVPDRCACGGRMLRRCPECEVVDDVIAEPRALWAWVAAERRHREQLERTVLELADGVAALEPLR